MTWPKFDTLFMTFVAGTVALNISYEGFLLVVLFLLYVVYLCSK